MIPRAGPTAALLASFLAASAMPRPAAAETCFRQCLAARVTDSAATDDAIRFAMRGCRDACERSVRDRLAAAGPAVEACRPQPLAPEVFRAVRGASPSYVVQSNAFTWDVRNPLAGKVIREIEVVAQTMDLRETVLTGTGTVMPGDQQTLLVAGFFDGYPNARYATRVRAISAHP